MTWYRDGLSSELLLTRLRTRNTKQIQVVGCFVFMKLCYQRKILLPGVETLQYQYILKGVDHLGLRRYNSCILIVCKLLAISNVFVFLQKLVEHILYDLSYQRSPNTP